MNSPSKALFLDRDGVINEERDYVYRQEEFEFLPGIFDLCRLFQKKSFQIFVITNQSGIGRGYYTEEEFHSLSNWMVEEFKSRDIIIQKVYHCPYHPEHGIGKYKKESEDRKPNPGMILKAKDDFNLDLNLCYLIGDKERDIQSGKRAGVKHNILFDPKSETNNSEAEHIVKSFSDVVEILE